LKIAKCNGGIADLQFNIESLVPRWFFAVIDQVFFYRRFRLLSFSQAFCYFIFRVFVPVLDQAVFIIVL
jgi:hypothetical protein